MTGREIVFIVFAAAFGCAGLAFLLGQFWGEGPGPDDYLDY